MPAPLPSNTPPQLTDTVPVEPPSATMFAPGLPTTVGGPAGVPDPLALFQTVSPA
jgi:hypothetical protein